MRAGRYIYGYMGIGREDEYLTTGLWNASLEYMRERNIIPEETALDRYLEEGEGWKQGRRWTCCPFPPFVVTLRR